MTIPDLQQQLAARLEAQTPHPVHPALRLAGFPPDAPLDGIVEIEGVKMQLPLEDIEQMRQQREALIARELADPLRNLCEPDEYRLIDLECAKKRRAMPGVALLCWLGGGIRSAKTYCWARRLMATFWFVKDSWCWGVHETDVTSATVMQPLIHEFMPAEIKGAGAKQTLTAKKGQASGDTAYFAYTPGTGFTGSKFYMKWNAHDWRGCAMPETCSDKNPCAHVAATGGRFEFRFYKQDEATMVGQKLTCAMNDEKVPPNVVKLIEDRLLQRAADTNAPEYMHRLDQIIAKLESGQSASLYDLACIYLGWQLISFTPKWGWTATVSMILQGARKYGHYDPRPMVETAMRERLKMEIDPIKRRELAKKWETQPWTLGGIKSVPRFAQPVNPRWLVAYLPTWANKFGGNWPGLVEAMQGKSDEDMRTTMFGDVEKNVHNLLPYDPEKHSLGWESVSFISSIYVVADPAPGKPWVIKWYGVDPANRRRVLQEWPNPEWEIEGIGKPDLWAVPSEHSRLNGDKGQIAKQKLGWGPDQWTRLIWQGNQRLAARLNREAVRRGVKHEIATEKRTLEWEGKPEWKLEGEFVKIERILGDKHYLSLPTQAGGGTLLSDLLDRENAHEWENATAEREGEGLIMLGAAMGEEIMGLPRMSAVPECVNTHFAWSTYTIPEDKQSSTSTDEACKDFVDPDRYLEMEGEEVCYVSPKRFVHDHGGGSY